MGKKKLGKSGTRKDSATVTGDDASFAQLFGDAKPLSSAPTRITPKSKPSPEGLTTQEAPRISFQRFDRGETHAGLVAGIDRGHLKKLRAGEFPYAKSIDLHRLTLQEAEALVLSSVQQGWDQKKRCLLVVHGRGQHSEGDAVLRGALPNWLTHPKIGKLILAFCSALPKHGGAGASYILLRRNR